MTTPAPDRQSRAIRLQVEVAGTPEEVWETVATGPGISTWFVPAEVDGDAVTMAFGPGMTEEGTVTASERPHRFVYVTGEGTERALAFEWLVEAREGGTSVVRLVNSGFGEGEDWDGEYDAMHAGWRLFLANLQLVRRHFPGQTGRTFIVNGRGAGGRDAVWGELAGGLGIAGAQDGQPAATGGDGVPRFGGTVARVAPGMCTLLLDDPGPGVLFVAAEGTGDSIWTSIYAYLFGPGAQAAVDELEPATRDFMDARFPADDPDD